MECREGRQLIYELSAKHRNCLLLNYAIQKILQAGHEDEVASVGSSLASYFGVFHRLMANRLKEVAAADTDRVESLAAELKVRLEASTYTVSNIKTSVVHGLVCCIDIETRCCCMFAPPYANSVALHVTLGRGAR